MKKHCENNEERRKAILAAAQYANQKKWERRKRNNFSIIALSVGVIIALSIILVIAGL